MTCNFRCRIWTCAGVLFSLLAGGVTVWGQADAPDETKPAAAGKVDDASAKAKALAEEKDPYVRAILQTELRKPEDQMRAVESLRWLQRPELAKALLKELLDAKLDTATLAGLQRRFGSAIFMSISQDASVQPEGTALADTVMKATAELGRDPKRLETLVAQLGDPRPAQRQSAMLELVRAGDSAVAPLLKPLAKPANTQQQAAIRTTLAALGDQAVDPLIAASQSPQEMLQVAVIQQLGVLKAKRAVSSLLAPALGSDSSAGVGQAAKRALREILGGVPTRAEATAFLARRLDRFLSGTAPGRPDVRNLVQVWVWDPEQQLPVARFIPARDAAIEAAARVARQLRQLAPKDAAYKATSLITALEVAHRRVGLDRVLDKQVDPIVVEAANAGTEPLLAMLDEAREQHFHGAAITLLRLLGQSSDQKLLAGIGGQPSRLVQALRDEDRRVRFAAARAIVALDPKQAFPGSSYLPEVLGYLAASGGRQRVLIGNPRADIARNLAGMLANLGIESEIAVTGRQVELSALADPDYVFVLISDTLTRPGFSTLLETLRYDPRTAELPIGLMLLKVSYERGQQLTENDPLTIAMAPPLTDADMALETRRLLEAAGRQRLSSDERLAQAVFALDTMAHWAEQPDQYGFYEVMAQQANVRKALRILPLSSKAAHVLGQLGTPRAQLALVEFAGESARPFADRRVAANAFKQAVQRRGLLLTHAQILRQYDVYNASEQLGRDTQQILASILDVLEDRLGTRSSAAENAKHPKKP